MFEKGPETIEFISSNDDLIVTKISYACESRGGVAPWTVGIMECYGTINFCSRKKIDTNKPFSVSMIDISNNLSISIINIWFASYNYAKVGDEYFIYEAVFQAEKITRGNLKAAYVAFLRKQG